MDAVRFTPWLPEIGVEIAESRLRGIKILFDEGKTASQLWGYAFTGDYRIQPSASPYMRGEWCMAMDDLRSEFPDGVTREQSLEACRKWLRSKLIAGVI